METRNYNGGGEWSQESILRRYRENCEQLNLVPIEIVSRDHVDGAVRWVYPVMDPVIEAAKKGDLACLQLCVEFIHQDQKFPFGRTLKSQAAKALRRQAKLLSDQQKETIRTRVLEMLLRRFTPQEYGDYVRLAKRIGMGDRLVSLSSEDRAKDHVRRFFKALDVESQSA